MTDNKKPKLELIISSEPTSNNQVQFDFEFEILLEGALSVSSYEENKERIAYLSQKIINDASFQDKLLVAMKEAFSEELNSQL